MTHVMIDLETWGKRPGCALRSIGAVVFDPVTGRLGDEFYVNISTASCEDYGLTRDPETVQWWSEQSDEAQAALLPDRRSLPSALVDFRHWFLGVDGVEFWAYGPNLDEVNLLAAFEAVGVEAPWTYKTPRCARTLLALAGVTIPRTTGVHHNALWDAKNQASAVHDAYIRLGLAGEQNRSLRQAEVYDWASETFGVEHASNVEQRGLRFGEEAIELCQTVGVDSATLHKLVDYIYAKPPGEIMNELGGVGITLLCLAQGVQISADFAESREFERVRALPREHFQARNKVKNDAGFNVVEPERAAA